MREFNQQNINNQIGNNTLVNQNKYNPVNNQIYSDINKQNLNNNNDMLMKLYNQVCKKKAVYRLIVKSKFQTIAIGFQKKKNLSSNNSNKCVYI